VDKISPTIAPPLKVLLEGLRKARLSQNWSQSEMAKRSNMSRAAYQNFENGFGNITLTHLLGILRALQLEENLSLLIPSPQAIEDAKQRIRARRAKPKPTMKSPHADFMSLY
jgi:transcriptional regulator with XRE-family HTH domain